LLTYFNSFLPESFIDYEYNLRNLLSSVISDAPPPVATYTYNGRNQIASTVIENGLFTASRSYHISRSQFQEARLFIRIALPFWV